VLQNTPLLTCKSTSFEKSVDNPWIIIIAANIDHPWIIIGDFNLTRKPTDKNSSSFNSTEANLFNDTINLLGLIEIPLLDRSYTWSNKREYPTLVHLDWCFVNVHWENSFPNTSLASLTRFTSGHVPLFATATSMIPKSKCFRFENAWVFHPTFKASITTVLSGSYSGSSEKRLIQQLKHCRRACRLWSRRILPIAQREIDTKLLIDALDLLEECRSLSEEENSLRLLAIQGLQTINSEKLSFWRQRFNLRIAADWDENSRFFHAAASGRRRKNSIPCLEHNGNLFFSHDAKSDILRSFYTSLLGSSPHTSWRFSLSELHPHLDVAGLDLSAPFTMDEITAALFSMDMHSSPGPDGFGPSFYKTFWSTIKQAIFDLFADFHSGSLHLDGLNRAHLILLPKKEGVRSAESFRLISLQNCPMKLFSKVMVNRLKPAIPSIVDPDQTGFVHDRSIAENFIYAADLLSCCHRRKVPTAVLKLDFRKAFDSVCWDSLDAILEARGFDPWWRSWVSRILSTGKTAIMLNGVPGRWINCRRGLRQGDPLSPYLFIIVADVLQRLIRRASVLGVLVHPIDPTLPCPVLQYADDTLILTRGDVDSIQALKLILDDFSLATGLEINFHKSTFVPMNVPVHIAAAMAAALGCSTATFPQTYLGLPLSTQAQGFGLPTPDHIL